jgi:hypothetical protein
MFQLSAHMGKATPAVPFVGALTLLSTDVTMGLVVADDPLAVMSAGVEDKAAIVTMI